MDGTTRVHFCGLLDVRWTLTLIVELAEDGRRYQVLHDALSTEKWFAFLRVRRAKGDDRACESLEVVRQRQGPPDMPMTAPVEYDLATGLRSTQPYFSRS